MFAGAMVVVKDDRLPQRHMHVVRSTRVNCQGHFHNLRDGKRLYMWQEDHEFDAVLTAALKCYQRNQKLAELGIVIQ